MAHRRSSCSSEWVIGLIGGFALPLWGLDGQRVAAGSDASVGTALCHHIGTPPPYRQPLSGLASRHHRRDST
jgi:hypothetical protein